LFLIFFIFENEFLILFITLLKRFGIKFFNLLVFLPNHDLDAFQISLILLPVFVFENQLPKVVHPILTNAIIPLTAAIAVVYISFNNALIAFHDFDIALPKKETIEEIDLINNFFIIFNILYKVFLIVFINCLHLLKKFVIIFLIF